MASIGLGIFLILHGLVHFWYVTLSTGWVPFQEDMGWTGQSWLLSGILAEGPLSTLAAAGYSIAAVLFIGVGVWMMADQDLGRSWILAPAVVSSLLILTFWDGSPAMAVQKGLLGLVINILVILFLR